MRYEQIDSKIGKSLRKQISTAFAICLVLGVSFGAVAAYAEISGAIIGAGRIIVQGRAKQVQHRDGGIVGEILVKEGQKVDAGQLLFRLDGTVARASLGIVDSQLDQLLAQEARLLAEQAGGGGDLVVPAELVNDTSARAQLLIEGQKKLYVTRQATREGRKAQLTEQVAQFGEKAAALEAQREAIGANLTLLDDQISDFAHLQNKGLMIDSQVIAVRRENASLLGSKAAISAEIAEARQAISQAKLQYAQIDEEFYESVLVELDQKRAEIAKLQEERIAAVDRLDRLAIHAPLGGYLHQLAVHTIGGIVSPGETLVSVIPADDKFLVEAHISPNDVDQLSTGQTARLRLSGLDRRTTPELFAAIMDVAADLTIDEKTGATYYLARLQITDEDIAKVGAANLRPGMPVEVFIETGTRSILSYLVKPISDQIQHAMRES